ncbi:hypothetical protein TELCIR_12557 [Teladorsagia circumcincta]|uniref:Uncharacterized protein n=1 Tax=Teladorsagia circumcincta TaxID=45464 RepID=A0A2G9U666_TELCI|nr:hypothetical protein TELCIR_12557 [Teladorsagia circumcincta]
MSGVLCDKKVPERLKSKIYRTVVRPFALYGAECAGTASPMVWTRAKEATRSSDKNDSGFKAQVKRLRGSQETSGGILSRRASLKSGLRKKMPRLEESGEG